MLEAAPLRSGSKPRGSQQARYDAFEAAFGSLRQTGVIRTLNFSDAGKVFGLAFAIEVLHRDLAELGSRLGND